MLDNGARKRMLAVKNPRLALVFAVLVLGSSAVSAQDQATIRSFDLMFRHLSELQKTPDNGQQPGPAQPMKTVQQKLNLDDAAMALLLQAAASYTGAVAPLDAEVGNPESRAVGQAVGGVSAEARPSVGGFRRARHGAYGKFLSRNCKR